MGLSVYPSKQGADDTCPTDLRGLRSGINVGGGLGRQGRAGKQLVPIRFQLQEMEDTEDILSRKGFNTGN